jgi:hypothetical protein
MGKLYMRRLTFYKKERQAQSSIRFRKDPAQKISLHSARPAIPRDSILRVLNNPYSLSHEPAQKFA